MFILLCDTFEKDCALCSKFRRKFLKVNEEMRPARCRTLVGTFLLLGTPYNSDSNNGLGHGHGHGIFILATHPEGI
jgi:hypothetical protein